MGRDYVRKSSNVVKDEKVAVEKLYNDIDQENMAGVIFFCSKQYNLDVIAQEINKRFDCPVIGCTTAGEIEKEYQDGGIVGISFSSEKFRFHNRKIDNLQNFNLREAKKIVKDIERKLKFSPKLDNDRMFSFLLIDAISCMEEQVTSSLYEVLKGVNLIGGSAGDDLKFQETMIYSNGKFLSDIAVFTIIESKLPFKTYKFQHYRPSDKDLIITEADPSQRKVIEIDGGPAAEELANIVGVKKDELTLEVYSTHPLMLQIGYEWYVRAIQYVDDDGSIFFACAIDNGLPLTVGKGTGLLETLKEQVKTIQTDFSDIQASIGCDCIHRKLEIKAKGLKKDVEKELQKINFIGFSTFGEQFNSIHVNQTLTCVVIGSEDGLGK